MAMLAKTDGRAPVELDAATEGDAKASLHDGDPDDSGASKVRGSGRVTSPADLR
jgi:hypothetical protein